MTHQERIRELVETIMDTGRSPEEVCAAYPDLLPQVRARWNQVRALGVEMDVLFPSSEGKSQFGAATSPPPVQAKFPEMPGYEVESVLGHGGMGVVYRARHLKLNRRIAVKMMLAGNYADPVDMARFQKEAEAVASLRHPHIVQIHDLGDFKGCPFFTMELMEGGSLAQKISGTPQPVKVCAETLATLAEAVHVAHASGIVHRDLKPGNILFSLDGIPKITDFGLARRTDDAHLTQSGRHVGTPSYMAPEQASGQFDTIDFRADIYSLGAMLYEMLTGRPPFSGRTPMETLSRALLVEPVRPSRLVSHIPRDLETICLKCLEKNPDKRYATAAELAADLGRFLRDEPIRARPIGTPERTWRWMLRHKGLSVALSGIALLLIVLAIGSLIAAAHFRNSEREQASLAEANRKLFEKEEQARKEEHIAREQATAAEKLEADARIRAEKNLYISQMNLGGQAWRSPTGTGRLLDLITHWQDKRPDFRDWEWCYLNSLCHREVMTLSGHTHGVSFVAWSADGTKLASAERNGNIAIWSAENGRLLFRCGGHNGAVTCLTWSPDGRNIASAGVDRTVRIWDAANGGSLPALPDAATDPSSIAWSPDGKQLAVGDKNGISLFDLNADRDLTKSPRTELPREHKDGVLTLAWKPQGGQLASGGEDFTIRIWDTAVKKQISLLQNHTAAVTSVAWSPDGARLASASKDLTIKIWDVAPAAMRTTLYGHTQTVSSVAWSPDGSKLVTGSFDQTVKLWSAGNGNFLGNLRGHAARVTCVAWNSTAARIASASLDTTVKIWDPQDGPEITSFLRIGNPIYALDWHGTQIHATQAGGTMKSCDISDGQMREIVSGKLAGSRSGVWSSKGKWCAFSGADGIIHVWDIEKNVELKELRGHTAPVLAMCASVDGKYLASCAADRTVRVWQPMNGTEDWCCKDLPSQVRALAAEPNNGWLVTGADDSRLRAFRWTNTTARVGFERKTTLSTEISKIVWSPDSKFMAVAGDEQNVVIVSAEDDRKPIQLRGHTASVSDMSWNSAGTRLATASQDKTVKIWDVLEGRQLLTLDEDRPLNHIAWSPDGMLVATSDSEQTIRVRDASGGYIAGVSPLYLAQLDARIEKSKTAPARDRAALWQLRAEINSAAGNWDAAAGDFKEYFALKTDQHWGIGGYWVAGTYPGDLTIPCPPDSEADPGKPVASFSKDKKSAKLFDWQRVPLTPAGFINFGSLFPATDDQSAYALMRVYSPQERQVAILFGSDDTIQLRFNGKQIYQDSTSHSTPDPTPTAVSVTLKSGWNTILARVQNKTEDHTLYLRLSDQPDDVAKGNAVAR